MKHVVKGLNNHDIYKTLLVINKNNKSYEVEILLLISCLYEIYSCNNIYYTIS